MTIPSRPAPAPPVARGQSAAAGANASIEQLRLQLQQQQQHQQKNGGIQRMTIKLPPPPKAPNSIYNTHNNNQHKESDGTHITRKFPQARYTPATDWDDSPFGQVSVGNTLTANGNYKKVPPPRPPPPKVQMNNRKAPPPQSTNILSNIFNRKKSARSLSSGATRVYNVSSGAYASSNNTTTHTSNNINGSGNSNSTTTSTTVNWNANWNSSYSSSSLTSLNAPAASAAQEAQLISFDSPPSSPTFTQKSNSDCLSVDSFSSDSNFSSPNNGSVSQPESGFEDDFTSRSRPATTSPLDPWETFDAFGTDTNTALYGSAATIGTAPVRNLYTINTRIQASNDNPLCNGKSLLPPAPSLAAPTIIKPKVSQKPRAPKPPVLPKPNFAVLENSEPDTPPSPPMPQCPPPPPPNGVSLLDVISGKADAMQLGDWSGEQQESRPYGVALYDFDGVEEGDLSFREKEKIYLLEQVSDEWYRGRTRAGCEGIFPSNYIDVKVPLQTATAVSAATTVIPPTSGYQQQNGYSSSSVTAPRVRCLYNFPAEYDGDLALKENDMVTIHYKINEDWLFGEINGRQGQFPANFLEYVPANLPMP